MKKPVSFPKEPKCEICRERTAAGFSRWRSKDGESWKLSCLVCDERELYFIDFRRFFKSPASVVSWTAHMSEKNWMDWNDFAKALTRLAISSGSLGSME